MLDNNFTEEYRRVSTRFDFNYSKFYRNSLGDLILSSNYLIDNPSIVFENNLSEIGSNRSPSNINILIDSVTFVSTNPDLENFLPLKFSFSGSKPQVDFSQASRVEVERYGYIKNNNLGVLSNKFSEIKELEYNFDFVELNDGIKRILGVNYGSSGRGFYVVFKTINDNIEMWYFGIGDGIYYRGEKNQINTNMGNLVLTLGINFEFIRIDGTSTHTFVLFRDKTKTGNRSVSLYALRDGFQRYDGTVSAVIDSAPYQERVLGSEYYASGFIRDYFIYLGRDSDTGIFRLSILRYNHSYSNDNLGFDPTRYEFLIEYIATFNDSLTLLDNKIIDLAVDRYFVNNQVFALSENGKIYSFSFLKDRLIVKLLYDLSLTTIKCYRINVGYNIDNKPSFSVVTWDPVGDIDFSVYFINISGKIQKTSNYKNEINNDKLEIKNGLSDIRFYNENKLYIHNSIDGSIHEFDFRKDPRIFSELPYSFYYGTISRYFNVAVGLDKTLEGEDRRSLKFYYSLNDRYNQPPVYKYTFHYDNDRIYKFNVNTNFNATLINEQGVSVVDLEIFRVLMDIRVRYSDEDVNPFKSVKAEENPYVMPELETCIEACQEPCVGGDCVPRRQDCPLGEDCNPSSSKNSGLLIPDRRLLKRECFKRCSRAVGSTSRVLGLVGEDFSIADFLNIYTNGI